MHSKLASPSSTIWIVVVAGIDMWRSIRVELMPHTAIYSAAPPRARGLSPGDHRRRRWEIRWQREAAGQTERDSQPPTDEFKSCPSPLCPADRSHSRSTASGDPFSLSLSLEGCWTWQYISNRMSASENEVNWQVPNRWKEIAFIMIPIRSEEEFFFSFLCYWLPWFGIWQWSLFIPRDL